MKNLYLYLWGAIVAMFTLSACTDEANLPVSEENPQEESSLCTFTIPEVPVHGIGGSSRTAISIVDNKLKFVWDVGDRIGILPDEGSQVYFTIDAQAAGGTQASFDGGAWALKPDHQYDAYFPFIEDIMLDRTAVPVDYTNQQQTGNNSMAHLGAHDYLAAQGTTNGQGGVNYTFQRMGAVAILNFTVPNAGTELTSVTLKANETCFTTKGKLDMGDLTIKNMEKSASLTVGVDYTTTAADEKVTVYFMCYPDQLEGKNLNVEVDYEGSDEPLYLITEGKNMVAGDGYILDAQPPYLTFSAASAQTFKMEKNGNYTLHGSMQYSVGGGAWTQLSLDAGIPFGGDGNDLRLRGKSSTGTANENRAAYCKITFTDPNVMVACTGDIRTLVDWEKYATADTKDARFIYLFFGCTVLTAAPELPATTLATYCYNNMFEGCTSLTTAPALPATALKESCYSGMFNYCPSLETAPELPATTLATYCYNNMFSGCTSLETAPVLPAPALAEYCYFQMFYGCTDLSNVTMLATNINAEGCLGYWLYNVATTGTFYKAAGMEESAFSRNSGGIPTGWTVVDYTESE